MNYGIFQSIPKKQGIVKGFFGAENTIYYSMLRNLQSFTYLPKSSTRRKSLSLFAIETARALTLAGETEGPAPAHVSHEDLIYYNLCRKLRADSLLLER